jgi:hypothetical protein
MPDEERLTGLSGKHMYYILGARLSNVNLCLVKQIQTNLKDVNGAVIRIGGLICDFSATKGN